MRLFLLAPLQAENRAFKAELDALFTVAILERACISVYQLFLFSPTRLGGNKTCIDLARNSGTSQYRYFRSGTGLWSLCLHGPVMWEWERGK